MISALDALDHSGSGDLFLIEYLDARGADGLARKYRMMFIGGGFYPLHLALGHDWKVHYFTSAMAEDDAYRLEEQRYLDDPTSVLGTNGMTALRAVAVQLGLDYAGIDFGLDAEGRILVFEVNATMVLISPDADSIWDYRRPAIRRVFEAAERMVAERVDSR
ncbi:hypothetical protein [Methylobacterium sp. J-030]|uniref:hypothetical protein n=1 Tax=Methylobacterium sp. J-030 TaxID=2836627 RepID=UPI00391DB98E